MIFGIPKTVSFVDDFLGNRLSSEWYSDGDVSIGGVHGLCQLVATDPNASGTQITLGAKDFMGQALNWIGTANAVLEVRWFANTRDCLATIGFVGNGDGYTPHNDFVALWRPGQSWVIQCANNSVLTSKDSSYIHVPGFWNYFRFELTTSSARFFVSETGLPSAVVNKPYVTQAPLLVQFALWATSTNQNAAMWLDWVSVTQQRY